MNNLLIGRCRVSFLPSRYKTQSTRRNSRFSLRLLGISSCEQHTRLQRGNGGRLKRTGATTFSVPLIRKKKTYGFARYRRATAQRFAHKSDCWNFISLWKFTRRGTLIHGRGRKVFEPAMSCKSIAAASFEVRRLPTISHARLSV